MNSLSAHLRTQINKGVEILSNGGVIAFPTETIYGLGASIKKLEAVERIYQIKGRDQSKALPLILSRMSQIEDVAREIPDIVWILGKCFWPGPLTIVVYRSSLIPNAITRGKETVAVRVSSHPVAIALVESLGLPITGTSANLSGTTNLTSNEEVKKQLGNKVDLVIDSETPLVGIESTIVDVTTDIPTIIREGAISREALMKVCKIK